MNTLGSRRAHYWKLQHMLRATGADAVAAFDEGALSSEDWAGMVERCRQCQWTRGCQAFLDQQAAAGAHSRAPQACCNSHTLDALRSDYPEVA